MNAYLCQIPSLLSDFGDDFEQEDNGKSEHETGHHLENHSVRPEGKL
jgi:hypothetical protein